jgi:thiol-disulfide isomerase/thioredoxin
MKKPILITSIAIIALLSGIEARTLISAPKAETNQASLTEFSLPDLTGKQRSIKEWSGKVLVINFWATWCPPCLKEMPEFEAMHQEFGKKGLQFIGIALDDPEPVKEFIASKKITYPILIGQDQGTKIAHDLGNVVNTVPFTVIVNQQRHIVKSHMGTLTRDELLEIASPLMKR